MSELALKLIQEEKKHPTGTLDLGKTGLTEIPREVFQLTHLKTLILSNEWVDFQKLEWVSSKNEGKSNRINTIPLEISALHELTWLILGGELGTNWGLTELHPLQALKQLEKLNLSYNQIADLGPVAELKELTSLNLSFNQIADLGPLAGLKELTHLELSNNQIVDLGPVAGLKELNSLDLRNNQIADLGPVAGLKKLNSLDLYNNQIADLGPVAGLKKLTHLELSNNQIEDISPLLLLCEKGLSVAMEKYEGNIQLHDNPITKPPIEIVQQGREAILNYFESLDRSKEISTLREVKLILVGAGSSGKTSLLKQLQGLPYDEHESQTHGINIARMQLKDLPVFRETEGLEEVVLHGWDFGGQEIMHASHQIFLTKRAIYLYVIDSRNDAKKDYWLQHIRQYGDGSPTFVAINKTDLNPNYDLERSTLNKKYPFLEQRFFRVSCAEGDGLDALKKAIGLLIPKTELYEMPVPGSWVNVKNALEQATDDEKYLSREQFMQLCEENGVAKAKEQSTLLQFLHDLGLVFHFTDLKLADFYVLDPHWVTVAVYKIMNTRQVTDGILREGQLDFILNHEVLVEAYDPADKAFEYLPEEQRYVVEIMAEFELLYTLEKGQYLIPDLLPKETEASYQVPTDERIHFVLKYDLLSQSLFNRLIIARKNDIRERAWLARNQVVLENETCSCTAFIQFDLDAKRIDMQVWGTDKRQYLTILRDKLYELHRDFHGLKVEQKLPIPGHEDHYVDFDELIGLERMGERDVSVGVLGKKFPIADLLDPIVTKKERLESRGKMDGVRDVIIHNSPTFHQEQKTDVTNTINISINIQNLLGEMESLKEDIADDRELLEEQVPSREIDVAVRDIEKAENAIAEIEQAQQSQQPVARKSKNRLKRFIDDLSDENSPTHKTLKALRKGKDYAIDLAELYNNLASNIGMPNVPPAVLALLKKW